MNDLGRQTKLISNELKEASNRVLNRGWFVLGPETEAFESEFASYCGVKHVAGLANGTDALELSLRAVGIGSGSRVATVANAGFYASTAINAVGAKPVYIDVELDTYLMSLTALQDELSASAIDAVVVTHLYGLLARIEEVVSMCRPLGIPVIEDCAQAHGALRNQRRAGSFGAVGCFSFYPTKNLGALGDGGAITTNDPSIASSIQALRQYGWKEKYLVGLRGGGNSRLDEIQAAFLRAKLPNLDANNVRRRAIARTYSERIRNPRVKCPKNCGDDYVAHLFVVRCDDRNGLRQHLQSKGVSADIHYPVPDYKQSAFGELMLEKGLPITDLHSKEILTLPCFPEMTDEETAYVINAVNSW